MAEILDTRKLMTGKDGLLYLEVGNDSIALFEVDSFSVTASVTNVDVQPVGSLLVYAVNSGMSFSISMSEMVVRDDVLMEPIIKAFSSGKMPVFTFQGTVKRADGLKSDGTYREGTYQTVTFRNCTPDGELGIMNLTPGEVIKRSRNFRINSVPEWTKKLVY